MAYGYDEEIGAPMTQAPPGFRQTTGPNPNMRYLVPTGGAQQPPRMMPGGPGGLPMLRQPLPLMLPGQGSGSGGEEHIRAIVADELNRQLPPGLLRAIAVPGATTDPLLMSPLALEAVTLNSTTPAANLEANPQRPFKGERLIVVVTRSSGAANVPVNIVGFNIGANSQFVGSGEIPAETFAPDAEGVRLSMSDAAPGVNITLRVQAGTSIPAGESIAVAATIIGRAVQY